VGTAAKWSTSLGGGASLQRSFTGFGLALLIFIPLGLLIGWYRRLGTYLTPLLELCRNTAALALIPVFILTLGIGQVSRSRSSCTRARGLCYSTPLAGAKCRSTVGEVGAIDGTQATSPLSKGVLASGVATIFTGIRLAGATSILVLLAAELQGATNGLGYLINVSETNFQIPAMYAGILTISIIGLAFNIILVRLERHFSTWRSSSNA